MSQKTKLPNEKELAALSSRAFARFVDSEEGVSVRIDGETVTLPMEAIRFLVDILTNMSEGKSCQLIPNHKEVTTSEAAKFLNVSRPYLIKLVESGEIPFTKIGTHRRIVFEDLMKYKSDLESNTNKAAKELSELSQELGLDY